MDDNRDTMEFKPEELKAEEKAPETGFILIDPEEEKEPLPELHAEEEAKTSQPLPDLHAEEETAEPAGFRAEFEQFKETVPEYETAPEDSGVEFVESYDINDRKKAKKEKKGFHISGGKLALFIAGIVALSAICGFGGSAVSANLLDGLGGNDNTGNPGFTQEEATGSSLTVAQIVDKAADSVVEIRTEATATDSWLQQYVTEGAGSGVIIDSEKGYIMTNNHVVTGANKVTVTLKNGNQYNAKIIGVDSLNDVGIIQIESKEKLTAAKFGDSDKLVVGELAVAIGNPLGELGGTVTAGIISARDRKINVDGTDMSLLQTDAAINPGNSGGGLFNQYGQLIGLVVAKSSGSDVEGLGFAIPINTASDVAQKIIKKGGNIASRQTGDAKLGITLLNIQDEATAAQYGLDEPGLYISSISHINPQNAGFEIGDKIIKVDGDRVKDFEDLTEILQEHAPGDKIDVVVERSGKQVTLNTELVASSEIQEQP